MDKYEFKDLETGDIVELELSWDKLMEMDAQRCLTHKGRRYQRHISPEAKVSVAGEATPFNGAYNRPLVSKSAGVHSSQAAEFNEAARRDGNTGVYYDPKTGNAHFESRSARRRELKRRGLHDRDGGYGDG